MSDSSKITTNLEVDNPKVLDSSYRLDTHDRRYIDNQIIGTQTHVVNSLISGLTATFRTLDSGSAAVNVGDCVVLKGDFITKAVNPDLSNAGQVFGVVLIAGGPNSEINVAIGGVIPSSVTGLDVGLAQPVICDTTTGRITRVSSVGSGDFKVGLATTTGAVGFDNSSGGSGGGGGGGFGGFATFNFTSDANATLSSSIWAKTDIRITDTSNFLTKARQLTVPSAPGDVRVLHNDTLKPLIFTTGSGQTGVINPGFSSLIDVKNLDIILTHSPRSFDVCEFGATGDGVDRKSVV